MQKQNITAALEELQNDPDIQRESLNAPPLQVLRGAHYPSAETRELVTSIGGLEGLREFTTIFYTKAFQDPVLDLFIRSHDDPHGERFASWICEKFGVGTPWSDERRTRPRCPYQSHGYQIDSPVDRSSAHFAAWHSPKRPVEDFGQHFKLDDSRVWMRLHFWSLREAGYFDTHPEFTDYYIKFIAHFVSVYEKTAPPFARESARWSALQSNVDDYYSSERRMSGIHNLTLREALKQLPIEERIYSGSSTHDLKWPYRS